MEVFTLTNEITGTTGVVYARDGAGTFEVVITDYDGNYSGGAFSTNEGDAIRYLLDYV